MHLIKAHFNIAKNILMGAFAILAVVFFGSSSFAANAGITYQGRILKPNGDVLSGAMTQFRVQIRTPNAANCLMFEEVHLLDMSSSNGLFSLTINDGSTTRTDISGYGLDRIFGNRGTFTFDPTTCSSGSNYIPNAEDGRKLQVYFKDETMASFEPMPPQTINYVPLALEAKQVAGFGIESLVRVQDGGGAMGNIAPLSNAAYTELLALTAGTSTQFNITSAKITDGTITGADLATNITVNTTNSVTAGGFTTTGNIVAANVSSSVGATREFQLVDPDDATAGAKRIKMVAPLAIASDYTLTWPLDDGTPGQMLTTDGAGVLSWTTAGIQAIVGSALGTGKIWVGAAGVAAEVTPSGDVTMTSAGAFTVATVGGSTAANIGTAEALANAATAASTNSAIVKRDPAGSFLSSSAKFTSSMILKDGAAGGEITLAAPTAFTSYALTLPVDDGTPSQVLTTNGTGTLSWTTPTTGTGDFKADGSVPMTGGIVALGTGSSAAPALTFAGSTTTGLWASGSQLSLASNGATRIRMSNNGNVGVNNSFASAYGFSAGYDVGMMGSNSGLNQFDLSTSGGNDRVTHAAGAGWRFGYYGEAHATTAVRGDLDISFYSGGVKSQAIYADRSGYVGFGTTTPTRQVDVAGPIRIAATALPGTPGTGDIAIDSADSNKLKWYNGSAWQTVGTGAGAGDFMANGSVPMTGNFTIDVSASTNAAPRIWGTGALVAGNASRVQIGDNSNVVQTGHSRKMQLASYWGMEIGGTRQASGSPAFVAGAATDPSLNVYGTTIGAPVLTATAASGQTANLQEWRGFGGTALSAVNALGHLGLGTATPAGILHVDGGTAAAGVNGTNISISAQTGGAGGGTRGGDITLNPGLSSNWEVGGMLKVGTNNPNASISLSSNSNGAYLSSSSQRTIVGQNFFRDFYGTTRSVTGSAYSGVDLNAGNVSIYAEATGGNYSTASPSAKLRVLASGEVGVGVTTPVAKLEVAGEVKVGNTALACAAGTEGAMRFNSTSKVMEYCNGTAWTVMQGAACSDSTSNAVVFTNLANQTLSTLVTSDIKQVTGINCSVVTSVSGPGTPAYRICADAACATVDQDWTTGSSSLINGQFVQLRQTTSGSGGVPIAATFTAGSSAIVWTAATTGDCASSPTPGTVCADGTVYVGLSPDGSVPMFTQRCDYGMSWNGSACTGSRIFISWNNGGSNNIATTYTNQTTGEANTSAIVLLANADAPHVAAAYCDGLSENTYGDWYLPSRNELILIYNSYTAIGNFVTSNNYWSSSETTSAQAYGMRFSDGAGTSAGKSVNNLVRCVRR